MVWTDEDRRRLSAKQAAKRNEDFGRMIAERDAEIAKRQAREKRREKSWQDVQRQLETLRIRRPQLNTYDARAQAPSVPCLDVPSPTRSQSWGVNPFNWFGDVLARFTQWLILRVWPFSVLFELGERMRNSKQRIRVWTAVAGGAALAGAVAGPVAHAAWPWGHVVFATVGGSYGPLVAAGCGTVIGWMLPSIIGCCLQLAVTLAGLALGLGLSVGGVWLIWKVFVALAGPSPSAGTR